MANNPITGATYLLQGLKLILRPGIRRYALIPLLINIVFFVGLWVLGMGALDDAQAALIDRLPNWLAWLHWLLVPLFYVAGLIIVYFTFVLFANLFAAPFNGLLAEAVERELTGRSARPMAWSDALKDLGTSVSSEVRKFLYFAPRALAILLLFLIPVVNLGAPVLWALFGAWMLAIGYLDYPMANHSLPFPVQRAQARTKRWLALGFGGAVMVALLVPVVNLVVVPSAVAGATALWVNHLRDQDT
ncbi:MAG: sulfate transporter CysZ [Gammaproteobacteria bacterium]|nr:sulfate transporter CysZ [Gammaproteobacteria bacterium]